MTFTTEREKWDWKLFSERETIFLVAFRRSGRSFGSIPFVPPPPSSTLCSRQLQSSCHYIVNYFVKIWHVHLGVANNMHPLSGGVGGGGGGGEGKRKRSKFF